jgi:4-hydroxy-3-methylbut-2-enyl diphosphate reductase IspH
VEKAADLRAEWFLASDVVGVTAGTSTPDAVIDLVEKQIQSLSDGSRELYA